MKLYAPEYYKKFTCIADRCRHSCCIGWEIDIDGDAIKKYSQSRLPYAEKIINSIEKSADSNHFRLCDGRRCAHLDSRGLCKIIIECGEDYLCDICREHPRFYNYTARGAEVGLGMSCEAAAKLILSSDGYAEINEIGELYGEPDFFEFDSNKQITELFSILADRSIGYSERLSMIYNKYNVSPSVLSDGEWRELLFSLEYLDDSHRNLFSSYSSAPSSLGSIDVMLERALAYFIYRHTASAESEAEFLDSLGLALFLERLLASVILADNSLKEDYLYSAARIISEELEYSEENTDIIKFEFSTR